MTCLADVENIHWDRILANDDLMVKLRQIAKKPISQLSPYEIALVIRKDMGIQHVIERAIAIVEKNPLGEANDEDEVVRSLFIRMEETWWQEHPEWVQPTARLAKVFLAAKEQAWDTEAKTALEQYGAQLTRESQLDQDIYREEYCAAQAFVERYKK